MSAVKCGTVARRHVGHTRQPRDRAGPTERVAVRAHAAPTGAATVTRGKRGVSNYATFRFDSRLLELSAREMEFRNIPYPNIPQGK